LTIAFVNCGGVDEEKVNEVISESKADGIASKFIGGFMSIFRLPFDMDLLLTEEDKDFIVDAADWDDWNKTDKNDKPLMSLKDKRRIFVNIAEYLEKYGPTPDVAIDTANATGSRGLFTRNTIYLSERLLSQYGGAAAFFIFIHEWRHGYQLYTIKQWKDAKGKLRDDAPSYVAEWYADFYTDRYTEAPLSGDASLTEKLDAWWAYIHQPVEADAWGFCQAASDFIGIGDWEEVINNFGSDLEYMMGAI
jgi:hypothetical protein